MFTEVSECTHVVWNIKNRSIFFYLCVFGCAFVCFLYEEGEGEGEGEVSAQRGTNLLLGNSTTKIT